MTWFIPPRNPPRQGDRVTSGKASFILHLPKQNNHSESPFRRNRPALSHLFPDPTLGCGHAVLWENLIYCLIYFILEIPRK